MANLQFDITSLFQQVFGTGRGKPFDSNQIQQPGIRQETEYPPLPASSDEEGSTFVSVRNSVNAVLPTGVSVFMPIKLGGLLLPNEPSIIIVGSKNIKTTELAGSSRPGTVKELIAIGDYQITIRGLAINYASKRVYPEEVVKELHDLFTRNESLAVESALTNLFGIYRLVIQSVTFPEMIGIQHAQAYEFQCISDTDFVLEIE